MGEDHGDASVRLRERGGHDGARQITAKARVVSASAIASWPGGGAWPERTARWCCTRVEEELDDPVVLGLSEDHDEMRDDTEKTMELKATIDASGNGG